MSDESVRHTYHPIRIAEVIQETHDTRSFVLDVPDSLAEAFRYRAGQFLTFQIPWEGETLGRCYSLSSTPGWDDRPKFTVKRVDDGRVSNWFNDAIHPGDEVAVMPPAGFFVLRDGSEAPLMLFGGGSGITPVISIIKEALATTTRRMKLLYANRDAKSVIFRAELDAMVTAHPGRLEVQHHLDAESGFLDVDGVRGALAGWELGDFYLCGPGPFMDLVESVLAERRIERTRLFVERFVSPPEGDEEESVASGAGASTAGPCERVTLHIDGETHQVPYLAGKSILESARAAGIHPPCACEDGYCGCCMAKLERGEVTMAHHSALDADEITEGWVLTCQAHPTTRECEVTYED